MKLSALGLICFGGIASSLMLVACSPTTNDQIASSREDIVINPTDTENWAKLTLVLPTGTCLPGNSCSRPLGASPTLIVDGTTVSLGTPIRLKPGEHTLTANSVSSKITLLAKELRTFVLPVARSKCTPVALPTISPTDFGKTPSLSNAACPTTAVSSSSSATPAGVTLATLEPFFEGACTRALTKFGTPGTACSSYAPYTVTSIRISGGSCITVAPTNAQVACDNSVAGNFAWITGSGGTASLLAYDQVFLPDTYKVTVGSSPPQSFTLSEGAVTDVPISLPVLGSVPTLFTASITLADPRQLPTVGAAQIKSSCSGDRSYSVSAIATGTLNLKAYTDSSCVYTLDVNGVTRTLSQTAANPFTLRRVDVDDVLVTREDGSTYTARGTYELYLGGLRVAGPYYTHNGIDALPGTYELVISYSTADGPKTQKHTFTL